MISACLLGQDFLETIVIIQTCGKVVITPVNQLRPPAHNTIMLSVEPA
jgi:hypothetical protein